MRLNSSPKRKVTYSTEVAKKKSIVTANFNAYLDERKKTDPHEFIDNVYGAAFLIGLAGVGACLWAGIAVLNGWMAGLGMAGIAAAMISVIASRVVKRKMNPTDPEQKWRNNIYTGLRRFFEVRDHSNLHRHIDPVALQLLEAGAYYWNQIRIKLDSLVWTGPDAPPTYVNLRIEVLNAADHAMDELAYLAANCLGEPQKKPSDDIKAIWQDLVELRIESVFERANDMFGANSTAYSHQSPHLNSIFHPARELAEKLKSLNEEVDRLAQEAATTAGPLSRASMGGAKIDSLLQNLHALRVASNELDDSIQGQQLDQR